MNDRDRQGSPPPSSERFEVELDERGGPVQGVPQTLDRRLFVQLQVFTDCIDSRAVVDAVAACGLDAVVYADLNDPRGIGVLCMTEDPQQLADAGRTLLTSAAFATLTPRPECAMLGRTYAAGREPNLVDFLLYKGRRHALNPSMPWAIWYPLRRTGAFNRLPRADQGRIMAEHATIGRAYGESGHAVDIRLECHGLDPHDNEFVLGILGPDLYPLSKLIKDMRATRQTSEFIERMGPFFVGRVLFQTPVPDRAKLPAD